MTDRTDISDRRLPAALDAMEAALRRADELKDLLTPLYAEEEALARDEETCRAAFEREQEDVDKLNKHSLRTLLLSAADKLDSRMDKEAFEADEARRALDAAVQRHQAVRDRITTLEAERDGLGADSAEYERLLTRFISLVADGSLPPSGDPARITRETARLNTLYRQYAAAEDTAKALIRLARDCGDALYDFALNSRDIVEEYILSVNKSSQRISPDTLGPWQRQLDNVCNLLNELDGKVRAFSSGSCIVPIDGLPRTSGSEMCSRIPSESLFMGDLWRIRQAAREADEMAETVGILRDKLEAVVAIAAPARADALARRDKAMAAAER